MSKKALITGITGQDGSYLAELLLSKGYEVHGLIRRASTFNTHRIDHIFVDPHEPGARVFLHYGDLSDLGMITGLLHTIRPDEVYHLGAQTHVRISFDMPEYTGDITGLGTTRMLEAIRRTGIHTRFYQASSSEMFGAAPPPQSETTPFQPRSPYAVAKVYSYWMVSNYREAYNLFASNGILFNHESPRRGEVFVSRKITRGLARILAGQQKKIYLGNLEAKRDWGFAPEFMETMWKMLQLDEPGDYVLGTGSTNSVREFLQAALRYVGVTLEWSGEGIGERGIVKDFDENWKGRLKVGEALIEVDPRYIRPTEVDHLQADIRKAKRVFGWQPRVTMNDLVKILVDYDMMSVGLPPLGDGLKSLKQENFAWTTHQTSFHERIREGLG
jgi:GDPmannose 4,6-dehydratase